MRFRVAAILLAAFLAVPLALAQEPAEKPPHEQLMEGLRGLFEAIFGAQKEESAPPPQPPAEVPPPPAKPIAQNLQTAISKGDYAATRRLLEEGADLEARDPSNGATPLHYAVMRGNLQIIQYLVERRADVNSRTKNGTTPLHTAVLYNRYEVAEYLLDHGADVNAQSLTGSTPLKLASAARNRPIGDLLRSRGAQER